MKWKKLTALFLAATTLVCFGGCTEKKTEKEDVVELTMWSGYTAAKESYTEIIDIYNNTIGKKDGVRVKLDIKEGGSIAQNIELAFQSGDAPDFFDSVAIEKLAELGYLLPVSEIPGGNEKLEKYERFLIEGKTVHNGVAYCMPLGATTQGLVYNKEMFKEAGLVDENGEPTPPKTYEEMREYAKKLTNPDKRQYGIIIPNKWSWFGGDIHDAMLSSVGHKGFDPVTGEYDFTGMIPIMNAYLGMKEDGSVYPGADGLDNDSARAAFATGKVGMKAAYSFDVAVYNEQFPAQFDWGVAPYPVVDENNKYQQRMDVGKGAFVNSKAPERVGMDKVASFWNFLTSDEYVQLLYQKGVGLPNDWEIVKDVEMNLDKKGWEEFAELTSISSREPRMPQYDATALVPLKERFINEVWSGKKTPEKMLEEYTADIEKATKKYYELHTNENIEDYIIADWNIKR